VLKILHDTRRLPKPCTGTIQFANRKTCPPRNRAASTRPIAAVCYVFVEASPSHALWDGEGTYPAI